MSSKSHSTNLHSTAAASAAAAATAAMNAANNKKRYVWPESLHKDFISAVFDVGLRVASIGEIQASLPELRGKLAEKDFQAHLQKLRVFRDRNLVFRQTYFEMEKATTSGKRSAHTSSARTGVSTLRSSSFHENDETSPGGEDDSLNANRIYHSDSQAFDEANDPDLVGKTGDNEEEDKEGEEYDPIADELDNEKINANIVSIDQTLKLVHIQLQQMAHSIQYNHQLYFQLQKMIARQHETFLQIVQRVNEFDPKLATYYQSALQPFFFHFAAASAGGFSAFSATGNSTANTGNNGSRLNANGDISWQSGTGQRSALDLNELDDDDDSSVESINMDIIGNVNGKSVNTTIQPGSSGSGNSSLVHNDQEDATMLLDSLGGRKVHVTDNQSNADILFSSEIDSESPRKRSRTTSTSLPPLPPISGSSITTDNQAYSHQHHGHQTHTGESGTSNTSVVGTDGTTNASSNSNSLSFNYALDHSHQHHHIHTYSHSHNDSKHTHHHDHAHGHSHTHATANGAYSHNHNHSHDSNTDGTGRSHHHIGASNSNGGKLPLSTSRTELNIMYEMRAQMDFHRLLLLKKENQLSQLGGISMPYHPTGTSSTVQTTANALPAEASGGPLTASSSTSSMGALAAAVGSGLSQSINGNPGLVGPATTLTHTNSLQSTGSGGGSYSAGNNSVNNGNSTVDAAGTWDFELTDLFAFLHDP